MPRGAARSAVGADVRVGSHKKSSVCRRMEDPEEDLSPPDDQYGSLSPEETKARWREHCLDSVQSDELKPVMLTLYPIRSHWLRPIPKSLQFS